MKNGLTHLNELFWKCQNVLISFRTKTMIIHKLFLLIFNISWQVDYFSSWLFIHSYIPLVHDYSISASNWSSIAMAGLVQGPEEVKWELRIANFLLGKWDFHALRLRINWKKKMKMGMDWDLSMTAIWLWDFEYLYNGI